MSDTNSKENIIQSDHDLLIRIDTKIEGLINNDKEYRDRLSHIESEKANKDDMSAEVHQISKDVNIRFADHERRMRKIEKYVWTVAGALAILEIILRVK